LEKWPAVRRHSVIEDGIVELAETLQNSLCTICYYRTRFAKMRENA